MDTREESLRSQIALGWIADMLVLSFPIFSFQIIRSILTEADRGFRTLRFDPGLSGMDILVWILGFYALMPVYVSIVTELRPRLFRWVAVAFAILNFGFNILHQFAHYNAGQKPNLSAHVPDITVHLIMLWVIVNSIRWARIPRPAAARPPVGAEA